MLAGRQYTARVNWLLDQLNNLFALEQWPLIATVLRGVLFLLVFLVCLRIWRSPFDATGGKKFTLPNAYRIFFLIMAGSFVLLLVHQAGWQLAGQSRPEFLAFMQLHDKRTFNPAHHIERGRILDRNGEVLAETRTGGKKPVRHYPHGLATAHVVGYAHPRYGASGMEHACNAALMGATPKSLDDWKNAGMAFVNDSRQLKGRDITLTLDIRLQNRAYRLLGQRRGAVLMMDIDNGDILVCVSKPSFDPHRLDNSLFSGRRGESVLLNRATHGLYPPGSTLKVFTAAAAGESGFKGRIDCPASGWTTSARYPRIHDYGYYAAQKSGKPWKGYGEIDLPTALAKSSNIFFARLGVTLGIESMHAQAEKMYFNRRIPVHRGLVNRIDVPGGVFPMLGSRDRYGLAQMSMGQGRALTTPLHMTLITAAIAAGGTPPRPRFTTDQSPAMLSAFVSPVTADAVAAMMRKAVTEGTGRRINRNDLPVAGKTGTADHGGTAPHAWFTAFAPYGAPRYAISVLVEEGGLGSQGALPIANQVLDLALRCGYMEATP